MSRKGKGDRGRERRKKEYYVADGADITREKAKARELRDTPWWRKKIASGQCYYCGRTFPPDELTMDHKIPLARGGRSERENLVPACKECNYKKKYLLPMEWEEYMTSLRSAR